jgi:ribosomal-protein-serine acetyltransferase
VLTDGTILLRQLQSGDVDPMYAAVRESIPEVSRWLPWCHEGYARSETVDFVASAATAWKNNVQYPFGIFDADGIGFLGGISINHIARTNRLANVGYWVRTARTRQGIAVRAVLLAARFAFERQGLTRLEIACIPTNTASRRVAEKAGARLEAIARNRIVMHGKAYDAALYSLLPTDVLSTAHS